MSHGKCAILIDAGFLKRKLGSEDDPITSQKVCDFTSAILSQPELKKIPLHRIYYYDAEPLDAKKLKPLTGGKACGEIFNFSESRLYESNKRLLDELKRMPFFAVRLGECHFRGWNVKPAKLDPKNIANQITISACDLLPNVQQKGVDMKIGLDISSLSLKNQVDLIVLVAGDSDFIPAMKFARREGKQIFLFTLGHRVRPEIFGHADVSVEKSAVEILSEAATSKLNKQNLYEP
jgi:uncharacterized LabA/DUF88 family protein